MRQRSIATDDEPESEPNRSAVANRMSKMDMFSKPKKDFARVQTSSGSLVSTVTLFVLALLLVCQLFDYASGRSAYHTSLSIEEKNLGRTTLNIDIDFPHVQCHNLRVDLADAAGTLRRNVTHSLHKIPVNARGEVVFFGESVLYDLFEGSANYDPKLDPDSAEYCGPCIASGDASLFPSESLTGKCCQSCEDVKQFYSFHGKPNVAESKVVQCLLSLSTDNPGCKIRGSIAIKKVRGALIFGPKNSGRGANTYFAPDVFSFQPTHRIHSLSFGEKNVARFSRLGSASPLDGKSFHTNVLTEVRYLIDAVPVNYSSHEEKSNLTIAYEYSAKMHSRSIHVPSLPQVTFSFDFYPIKISNVFQREPFGHFLVRICGTIGGVFVIFGCIDSALYSLT